MSGFNIKDVIGLEGMVTGVLNTISKHVPIPVDQLKMQELKNAIESQIISSLSAADVANAEVNKIEAQSTSWFVSGWRPTMGWICDLALFTYYIPRFILIMYFWTIQTAKTGVITIPPEAGIGDILGLVATLLGGSTIRYLEKKALVDNRH
jgi:hypothetical protein